MCGGYNPTANGYNPTANDDGTATAQPSPNTGECGEEGEWGERRECVVREEGEWGERRDCEEGGWKEDGRSTSSLPGGPASVTDD